MLLLFFCCKRQTAISQRDTQIYTRCYYSIVDIVLYSRYKICRLALFCTVSCCIYPNSLASIYISHDCTLHVLNRFARYTLFYIYLFIPLAFNYAELRMVSECNSWKNSPWRERSYIQFLTRTMCFFFMNSSMWLPWEGLVVDLMNGPMWLPWEGSCKKSWLITHTTLMTPFSARENWLSMCRAVYLSVILPPVCVARFHAKTHLNTTCIF